ncbi:MAG: hypothetical protein COB09_18935 [Thalassobium sp.]|nr:MAG: hypothetical protein COB09_18935 [Thalassobium sp.]
MSDFIKKPCAQCPYRSDVKPFLRPERGEELAYAAQNPYNTFYCHKTLDSETEDEDNRVDEGSKICAGFLSLQHNENGETFYDDEGFEPSDKVYGESYEMEQAYAEGGI